MKNFWAYISNGKYSVGTIGQTVYLYNENGDEIGKFKDLTYAYTPVFSPNGDFFAVKSKDGRLALYSLKTYSLMKKFRYSKFDAAQDGGFCFSPDGNFFINLESHGKDGLQSAITLYSTTDFSIISQLKLDSNTCPLHVEFDDITGECYILGLIRGYRISGFIGKHKNNAIVDRIEINENDCDFYNAYFDLKMDGFTEKSHKCSCLENKSLDELKTMNISLSELYNKLVSISAI